MKYTIPIIIGGVIISAVTIIVIKKIASKILFVNKSKSALQGKGVKVSLCLVEKKILNYNTNKYTFALPTIDHVLGHSLGNSVFFHAEIDGEIIIRPYTPINLEYHKGYAEFIIKTYWKNVIPQFPNGGKMTQYLEDLPIESCMEMSGPYGNIFYKGNGEFETIGEHKKHYFSKRISLLCGGTGITPMYPLIQSILESKEDKTQISLIYSNTRKVDILLRDELEKLRDENKDQFKLWYTLESPPTNWPFDVGYITSEMLEKQIFPPSDDSLVLICGPPNMVTGVCKQGLLSSGYNKNRIIIY